MAVRKLVVCGDFHCGSDCAIMPNGFETVEGNIILQNTGQQWLWHQWERFGQFVKQTVGNEPYAILFVGDAIEGIHHKTTEILSARWEDHARMAIQLLQPMVHGASAVMMLEGTECHTLEVERKIGKEIGAMKGPDGHHCFKEVDFSIGGSRVFSTHHISTTSRVHLAAGRLSIALANLQLERVRSDLPVPRGFIAGHCHRLDYYTDGHSWCLTTPSWQWLTRHGRRVVSTANPHVGGAVLCFEQDGRPPVPRMFREAWPRPEGVVL